MTGEPVEASSADRLDAAFAAIEQPVTDLRKYGRRTRALVWSLTASLAADLLLTFFVVFFAVRASDAADHANEATEATQRLTIKFTGLACEARNDFKELDLKRWLYVLQISAAGPPGESPSARKVRLGQAAQFREYISDADAAEDCTAKVHAVQDAQKTPR